MRSRFCSRFLSILIAVMMAVVMAPAASFAAEQPAGDAGAAGAAGREAGGLIEKNVEIYNVPGKGKRIRSLTDPGRANVPVIAVTANAFKEDIKKAIDAGMDAHVSKPVSPEAMMGTISRFL